MLYFLIREGYLTHSDTGGKPHEDGGRDWNDMSATQGPKVNPADLRSASHQKLGVKVKVTQLCLTLCDPMDYTVHGIL